MDVLEFTPRLGGTIVDIIIYFNHSLLKHLQYLGSHTVPSQKRYTGESMPINISVLDLFKKITSFFFFLWQIYSYSASTYKKMYPFNITQNYIYF